VVVISRVSIRRLALGTAVLNELFPVIPAGLEPLFVLKEVFE